GYGAHRKAADECGLDLAGVTRCEAELADLACLAGYERKESGRSPAAIEAHAVGVADLGRDKRLREVGDGERLRIEHEERDAEAGPITGRDENLARPACGPSVAQVDIVHAAERKERDGLPL